MMPTPETQRVSAALQHRILSAFPAGHYALDAFLRLTDIVESRSIPSAAVECVAAPKLLLNPEFIAEHCRTDEHLFMLVMHELHHVLLGHTRLFRRVTALDNIAFDAVINAILSRLFPQPTYTSFFTTLYAANRFPEALLRPPEGWPGRMDIPKKLAAPVQQMIRTLYSEASGTYKEVYDLFQQDATLRGMFGAMGNGIPTLLGDHSPEDTPGRGEAAANHPALNGAVRSIVEQWPMPPDPITGRSVGGELRDAIIEAVRPPPRADQILRTMLRRMVEADARGGSTHRSIRIDDRPIEAPLPTIRDRRAFVASALGWSPLIYRNVVPARRLTNAKGVTSVYVDVSGSTREYWSILAGLVRPYVERKLARLFAFSEVIDAITPDQLRRGRFQTTGGTDGTCVWAHAIEEGFRKIVVLTDGYVGAPSAGWKTKITAANLRIRVALTPEGYLPDLEGVSEEIVELPLLTK